ncbi:GreA/GreB family elongation factor [Hyphococcus luteus]|uniref:Nucleoside diphosphate kinase regulator n=1 Tax=Hyphococcus luteus TaxID=2058213 RepID=A0A2S7KB42_9PROT|nr:GreA/GreB family elongation factor [Marinicaulis flavus]PQA89693.1 hypothetical protein CW354_02205 [Marinicaulis flavus]
MPNEATEIFKKPAIYITEADYDALSPLISAANGDDTADFLADEIERAIRVTSDVGGSFVKLGSCVVFKDLATGVLREVQLTMPKDADISASRVSVLAPVGASLIGLTEKSRFQWIGADGKIRELEVVSIQDPKLAA